jgi:hypothetical protein
MEIWPFHPYGGPRSAVVLSRRGQNDLYGTATEEDRLVEGLLAGKTVDQSIDATSAVEDFLADLLVGVGDKPDIGEPPGQNSRKYDRQKPPDSFFKSH